MVDMAALRARYGDGASSTHGTSTSGGSMRISSFAG
jgi:hypothetical protein